MQILISRVVAEYICKVPTKHQITQQKDGAKAQ